MPNKLGSDKATRSATVSTKNPKVDFYFSKEQRWHDEIESLRTIVLECGLTETLKWGVPCYTLDENNVVLIHVFKEYCALLFFKGALLKDSNNILVQQTNNVQAARQIRFIDNQLIIKIKSVIKAYIHQAIEVEKAGLKVILKKTLESVPDEFQTQLDSNAKLRTAFDALTPGRRRAYVLHFTAPKQSKTRTSRVDKCLQRILSGKGLDD